MLAPLKQFKSLLGLAGVAIARPACLIPNSRRSLRWQLLPLLLAGLVPLPALASPVQPPHPTLFTPVWSVSSGIRVLGESLTLDCRGLPDKACSVRIEQVLICPPRESTEIGPCRTPVLFAAGLHPVMQQGAGVLRVTKFGPLNSEAVGWKSERSIPRPPQAQNVHSGQLVLARGATATLETSGDHTLLNPEFPRFLYPAAKSRHRLFSDWTAPEPQAATFFFVSRALRGRAYSYTLDLRFPVDWVVKASLARANQELMSGQLQRRLSGDDAEPSVGLWMDRNRGIGPFQGGIVLGFGSFLERTEFRARLGYEFAAPAWLLYSINIDTNFKDDVVIAPHIVASLPAFGVVPTLAAGVGLPVRVTGTPEVGVRFLVTVQFAIVAFNVSFDVYPERASKALETTASALVMF